MLEPRREAARIERLAVVCPRGFLQRMQRGEDLTRGHETSIREDRAQVGEQADAEARLDASRKPRQAHTAATRAAPRPVPAGRVGDREQRLPHVGVAVLDTVGHRRPDCRLASAHRVGPGREPVAQRVDPAAR